MSPHAGNFVEWTEEKVKKYMRTFVGSRILVVSPGYTMNISVWTNGDKDLIEYIDSVMLSPENPFVPFDAIILSRVFEHLPIRELDWYIYNMFKCLKKDGVLVLTVPDMDSALEWMKKEIESPHPDHFILFKTFTSLFNEGHDIRDFHKFWTNEKTVKYFLEREGLFKIIDFQRITVDTRTEETLEFTAIRL